MLIFLALYCAVGAWLPWEGDHGVDVPGWAEWTGFDHPFSSPLFLLACLVLFVNTLACTWGKRRRIRALQAGALPPTAARLRCADREAAAATLREWGFTGAGDLMRRHAWALWGGWVLHVGLLLLMAGVLVQQAFHDSGAFELSEGERVLLDAPAAVFDHERGPLAPSRPPPLTILLDSFDAFLHQPGYAPAPRSRLRVERPGHEPEVVTIDRADGVRLGTTVLYHGVVHGLALVVDIEGKGLHSLHLHDTGELTAAASFTAPDGSPVRFVADSQRSIDDPMGTGDIRLRLERHDGSVQPIVHGVPFAFGSQTASVSSLSRWSGFTYSRSPGLPGVFLGFFAILAGCGLLLFPAGLARLDADGEATVWVVRGREVLVDAWSDMHGSVVATSAADG